MIFPASTRSRSDSFPARASFPAMARLPGTFLATDFSLLNQKFAFRQRRSVMAESISILGIAGSLRKASYNKSALRAAQGLCPQGATLDSFGLEGIPPFNQDEERNPPKQVVDLKARIRAADAILLVTPEYNYSIPGVLKNAIDWASRPYGDSAWNGKPVAVMGASVGAFGTVRAQYHLRQCFLFLNMDAVIQPEVT